jgi:hypothetical protein
VTRKQARLPHSTLTREAHLESMSVPAGDPGEQLIANLLISLIACHLGSADLAASCIACAHSIAQSFPNQSSAYRPLSYIKVARLTGELEGRIETVLVPIMNNRVVAPISASAKLNGAASPPSGSLRWTDVEVIYLNLCLRSRSLKKVIGKLINISPGALVADVESILGNYLTSQVQVSDPLTCASDHFMLARSFIARGNFTLAELALKSAGLALDRHVRATPLTDHAKVVRAMKEQMAGIADELRLRAS